MQLILKVAIDQKLTNFDEVAMAAGGKKMQIFVEGCILLA